MFSAKWQKNARVQDNVIEIEFHSEHSKINLFIQSRRLKNIDCKNFSLKFKEEFFMETYSRNSASALLWREWFLKVSKISV